ncbi:AI-2E family transporter [Marinicrinis sediminis]|uniref:AI-2E family transporter n=1 Tax=Marinicrinis sediminis TaxID=1652465 RepID=A0ABW5RFH1_9BACL
MYISKREKTWAKKLVLAILVLLAIYLLRQVAFVFIPLIQFLSAIFIPFVLTGVLYYLLRPLMRRLRKWKIPSGVAVLIIYLILGSLLSVLIYFAGPTLNRQVVNLIDGIPEMASDMKDQFQSLEKQQALLPQFVQERLPDWMAKLQSGLEQHAGHITDQMIGIFNWLGNLIFMLGIVPFTLYYVLKDGHRLQPKLIKLFPRSLRGQAPKLLDDLDSTIASYILGQALVSLCVGTMLFIGYWLIGLDYAVVLALIGLLLNVVPFLGPILAAIPAVIVAFFQSPMLALYVIIIMVIAQQIEGNLISPQVMGRTLDIHPLTILTLLLAASSVAGLWGILFAVPAYALVKVIVQHSLRIYRIKAQE